MIDVPEEKLEIETDKEFDLEDLKLDLEATRKTNRWDDAPADIKDIFHVLEWNIIDGEFKETTDYINPLLEAGVPARTLISGPMSTGIAEVGRRFKMDEYFLPEVMMSAKCMQAALVIIKPLIIAEKADSVGTCVIGTIQGDLHDIGKNIVSMMLEAAGFDVFDLGVSTPPEAFIAAIREHKPQIVGFSALLTTTMNMQGETLKLIIAEGLRDDVKVLVGGAPISQVWADKIGADAYCGDALIAVEKAKACVQDYKDLLGGASELRDNLLAMDESE